MLSTNCEFFDLRLHLVAKVFFSFVIAHFAFDLTTPDESAFTLLLDMSYSRLVAAATAQQSASINAMRRLIAQSPLRAQNTQSERAD